MATLTIPVSEDTWVMEDDPTRNQGASVLLSSKTHTGNATTRVALLRVPLTDPLLTGATINSATLTLYNTDVAAAVREYVVKLLATSDWTEAGATWNTRNGTTAWAGGGAYSTSDEGEQVGSFTYPASTAIDTRFDITLGVAAVQAVLGGSLELVIRRVTSASGIGPAFRSSDTSVTSGRPILTIEYTAGGGTTVVTATRGTTWGVASVVTSSRATTWNLLAVAGANRVTTWGVLASVTASRASAFDILRGTAGDRATAWAVLATVASERAATFDVARLVMGERATGWDITTIVAASRASTWDIDSSLGGVAASRATDWDVVARVTGERASVWESRAVVAGLRSSTWDVLGRVQSERVTQGDVFGLVVGTRGTWWDGLAVVAGTRTASWDVASDVVESSYDRIEGAGGGSALVGVRAGLTSRTEQRTGGGGLVEARARR